ncbi:MAG: universal stress protein [Spirochaetales bacterium]|nr:universal stress protein [Spirochaetales bacterium]
MEMFEFKKIMFCTDFSPASRLVFSCALTLTQDSRNAELVIFHVIPEPDAEFWKTYIYEVDDVDQKARSDIDDKLHEAYLKHIPAGVKYSVKVNIGEVDVQILEFARENDVDCIVMGRQGRSSFRTILFGNITEKITRKALCPVLVIPATYGKENLRYQ